MTINSILRVVPCIPEIRIFSLLNRKEGVDVELIITRDPEENRTVRACVRKGQKLEGLVMKDNSAADAISFVGLLWNACKDDKDYTLSNLSRIGTLTAKIFPDFARTRKVVDTIEDSLHLNWEEIDAYLAATKAVRHGTSLAFYPEEESHTYKSDNRPLALGSLSLQ